MDQSSFYILIVIVVLVLLCTINTKKEGYYSGITRYCRNCGYLGRKKCNDCVNCGWCVNTSGEGMCVPGDHNGPYFRKDRALWNPGKYHNRIKKYRRYFW